VRWHKGKHLVSDNSSLVRRLDPLFLDIVHAQAHHHFAIAVSVFW
jgi:hypothetical protein